MRDLQACSEGEHLSIQAGSSNALFGELLELPNGVQRAHIDIPTDPTAPSPAYAFGLPRSNYSTTIRTNQAQLSPLE
jgi:hypothetical protein